MSDLFKYHRDFGVVRLLNIKPTRAQVTDAIAPATFDRFVARDMKRGVWVLIEAPGFGVRCVPAYNLRLLEVNS